MGWQDVLNQSFRVSLLSLQHDKSRLTGQLVRVFLLFLHKGKSRPRRGYPVHRPNLKNKRLKVHKFLFYYETYKVPAQVGHESEARKVPRVPRSPKSLLRKDLPSTTETVEAKEGSLAANRPTCSYATTAGLRQCVTRRHLGPVT